MTASWLEAMWPCRRTSDLTWEMSQRADILSRVLQLKKSVGKEEQSLWVQTDVTSPLIPNLLYLSLFPLFKYLLLRKSPSIKFVQEPMASKQKFL